MPSTSPCRSDKKSNASERQFSTSSKPSSSETQKSPTKDATDIKTESKHTTPPPKPNLPMPTMEDLAQAEQSLANLIARKKAIDKSIAALEANIYALEGNYLEDTQNHGNIIKGFDYYLTGGPGRSYDRRASRAQLRWDASERIFSGSSFTFQKALELKQREEMSDDDRAGSPYSNSSGHYRYNSDRSTTKKKKKLRIEDDD